MSRVMRKRVGEHVELVNGKGQLIHAEIRDMDDDSAELLIQKIEEFPPLEHNFIIIQGIPNLVRLEIMLEKCTELGCSEFWLYFAHKSDRRIFSDQKKERLKYITVSALKQCGGYYLPKIHWFENKEEITPPSCPLFYGDIRPDAKKRTLPKESCAFLNGPESGFSDDEMAYFEKEWNAQGISLHNNILRTETAAIAAAALHAYGTYH